MPRLPIRRTHVSTRIGKHALFFLSVIGCVVFFILSFRWFSESHYLHQERFSVVFASNPPAVLSVNRRSGEFNVLIIPEDTYIEVPQGFGSYRVGALWNLGQVEKRGGEVLLFAVRSFLGVPIDGWIGWTDNRQRPSLTTSKNDVLKELAFRLSPGLFLQQPTATNLSLPDKILLWWTVKQARGEAFIVVNLGDKGVLMKTTLADGSAALKGDPDLVDKVSQTLYFEEEAQKEVLPFRVLNATDVPGSSTKIARLLTNIGYHTIGAGNAETQAKNCSVGVPSDRLSAPAVKRLGSIISCPIRAVDRTENPPGEGVVIVGANIARLW